jgi:hypothetical protein
VANSAAPEIAPQLQRRTNEKSEIFAKLRSVISVEKRKGEYFRKKREIRDCSDPN